MRTPYDEECDKFTKEFIQEHKPVLRYVRDKKRRPVGLLIGCLVKGRIKIGYSKCMLKRAGQRVDQFQRNRGIAIAGQRALAKPLKKKDFSKIPHTIRQYLPRFLKDCKKFFKTERLG